jgi:hypothetical protein
MNASDEKETTTIENGTVIEKQYNKADKNVKMQNTMNTSDDKETSYTDLDQLLEKEKQHNKSDAWNKLDKTVKIQKLHIFAEKYGKENILPMKDVKSLKHFFTDSLEKNKLQKTKDVVYDKEKGIIQSIPSLFFNIQQRLFTLKQLDKRVSTLKSLTPHRVSASQKIEEN